MIDHSSELSRSENVQRVGSDVMSELLLGMRLRGLNYNRVYLSRPFGVRFGNHDVARAQFHFVARGPVYLRCSKAKIHVLQTGDAVLLPLGLSHELLSAPDISGSDIKSFVMAPICSQVGAITACNAEEQDDDVLFFSGCMEFDLGSMSPLISMMPEVMQVGTLLDRNPEILPILEAMAREVCTARAGYGAIVTRLADVVSASIVRGWVECGCGDASGWVEALRDPRLGRVISALHRDPGRDWTVASMAAEMGASRSVFAERFLAITGITPLRYVADLRMRLATQWIRQDRMPVDEMASRLGYGSAAAFSRAFKRVTGTSPGEMRRA
ncbi:AraC family transcriptional regulator [Thalassospira sp. TSL5-1]|uniref:AraC family transcriptional regulator n=1 Tax=Thalassospira sp. TSL5-1 TaxID=1544451 RepID=UPI00093ED534|nr:AraC family transcriptional regulator [Thalassospira sp. TSL5-1]OKH87179.1 AraC family transcriptional regulator [Thalassospira sp. TSL5-1]